MFAVGCLEIVSGKIICVLRDGYSLKILKVGNLLWLILKHYRRS